MPEPLSLYLVDGSSFIHRAYHAVRPLSTRSGVPTNAVFGFTSMLLKLLADMRPSHVAVAFDGPPAGTFRAELYPEYKAHRPPAPEDLVPQFDLCRRVTRAFNIVALEDHRVEADDILATLALRAAEEAFDVTIVSSDKDLMQLVGPRVVLWDTMRDRRYDPVAVREKLGVFPEKVRDLLALTGDASDNVPGVTGIGPKTAAALLEEHGDLEGVLLAAPKIKGKRGETLVEQAQRARLSGRLVDLKADVDLPVTLADLKRRPIDLPAVASLFEELDFSRMLEQVKSLARDEEAASEPSLVEVEEEVGGEVGEKVGEEVGDKAGESAGDAAGSGSKAEESAWDVAGNGSEADAASAESDLAPAKASVGLDRDCYETIRDIGRLGEVLALAVERGELAVDLETTSLNPPDADIVGIALCWGEGEAGYVPVAHRGLAVGPQPRLEEVLARLRPLLEEPSPLLHMQNHKYETAVFRRHGVTLAGVGCDPMMASYLLDSSQASHGLDALAQRELGHRTITFKEVTGSGKAMRPFDEVEVEVATRYAAEDAEVTFLLAQRLLPRLREAGLEQLLYEVEVPLAKVLACMELAGVGLDLKRLTGLSGDMNRQLVALERQVEEAAGMRVNLASPKQLQVLLFEHLGLKPLRKTKTGLSTDAEVLEQLATEHPVAALIHEHRQIQKLKGTYVDALPRLISPRTGRLHTSYNQAVAATGRLSSSEPNLQNIPIRTEMGREIRRAFVAPEGQLLVAADYSQIELRVLAHLSGDEALREAFMAGEDVHGLTAAEVFGVPAAEVDREMRRVAKAVNFGVIYGQSAFGLARQLKIGRSVAAGYIESYFIRHRGVKAYMDRVVEEALATGQVTTILGRRRPLPDLKSRNPNQRAGAERMARNTPIQGSAADIIKLAMLRCHNRLERDMPTARMLMTVHDELVFEVPEADAEALAAMVRQEMASAMELSVPLVVDVGMGRDWLEAH